MLAGGNLTLLFTQAAAGRLRLPDGAVVVIEDVTEAAYRVDRMLTALLVGGAFDRVSAVVVGDFSECPPSRGVSVEQVLTERLSELRVPVLTGLGFGHGERNLPLVFGAPASVDGAAGTLTLGWATCAHPRVSAPSPVVFFEQLAVVHVGHLLAVVLERRRSVRVDRGRCADRARSQSSATSQAAAGAPRHASGAGGGGTARPFGGGGGRTPDARDPGGGGGTGRPPGKGGGMEVLLGGGGGAVDARGGGGGLRPGLGGGARRTAGDGHGLTRLGSRSSGGTGASTRASTAAERSTSTGGSTASTGGAERCRPEAGQRYRRRGQSDRSAHLR